MVNINQLTLNQQIMLLSITAMSRTHDLDKPLMFFVHFTDKDLFHQSEHDPIVIYSKILFEIQTQNKDDSIDEIIETLGSEHTSNLQALRDSTPKEFGQTFKTFLDERMDDEEWDDAYKKVKEFIGEFAKETIAFIDENLQEFGHEKN